jgi:hypothetical protein
VRRITVLRYSLVMVLGTSLMYHRIGKDKGCDGFEVTSQSDEERLEDECFNITKTGFKSDGSREGGKYYGGCRSILLWEEYL